MGGWGPAAGRKRKPASPSCSDRNGLETCESSWKSALSVYVYRHKHISSHILKSIRVGRGKSEIEFCFYTVTFYFVYVNAM